MNKSQEELLKLPALGLVIYTNESGKDVICGNWSEINFRACADKVWFAPRYTQDWEVLCPLSSLRVFMRSNDHLARSTRS